MILFSYHVVSEHVYVTEEQSAVVSTQSTSRQTLLREDGVQFNYLVPFTG